MNNNTIGKKVKRKPLSQLLLWPFGVNSIRLYSCHTTTYSVCNNTWQQKRHRVVNISNIHNTKHDERTTPQRRLDVLLRGEKFRKDSW